MRIRRLLLGVVLVAGTVLALPGAAHASPDYYKKLYECVVEAVEGHPEAADGDGAAFQDALEDCRASPSLLLPAVPEIIWGGLAFFVVLGVLMKFAFPALKKGLKAREDKIREDLESASRAREEAEAESAQYRAALGDARSEASAMIESARADADRVRRELVARAEAEATEIRQRAEEDVRLAQERAMSELRTRVADLTIDLAEKVVERNLDRDTQVALIESYINSVGNGAR